MRRSIVITKATTPAAVDNGSVGLTGVAGALSAGSVSVSGAAWNLPATISVQQDGTVGLRQYALNAGAHTISVSGLPTGVTYNAGLEQLEGASTGTASATVTFTLTLGLKTVEATATVSLYAPGSYPATHDFTGLPLTADGWTDLDAMITSAGYSDARIMYVSNSGNDSTGQVYSQAQVNALGGTPTNPDTPPAAFASVSAAWANLRHGYPDVLLVRRGDSFQHSFSINRQGGRSASERRIIAAYGGGPRPVINLVSGATFWTSAQNYVIADLDLVAYRRQPGHPEFNTSPVYFDVMFGAGDILFENIRTSYIQFNIQSEAGEPEYGWPYNVAFRRSTVEKNYAISPIHAQGAFIDTLGAIFIEECIFDRNGGNDSIVGAHPTTFNRNMYISQTPDITVRETITARGATGDQLRRGGLWERNLMLKQTWGVGVSHGNNPPGATASSTIRYNVQLDGANIGQEPYLADQFALGWGIVLDPRTAFADVYENIIAHNISGDQDTAPFRLPSGGSYTTSNINIHDNVVYKWGGPGLSLASSLPISNGQFANNKVTLQGIVNQSFMVSEFNPTIQDITFSSNTYYTPNQAAEPFRINDGTMQDLTIAEWESLTGESVTFGIPSYPDPERTITTYMASLGESGLTYDEALDLFMERAIAKDKGSWDLSYTAPAVINYIRAGFGLGEI